MLFWGFSVGMHERYSNLQVARSVDRTRSKVGCVAQITSLWSVLYLCHICLCTISSYEADYIICPYNLMLYKL